MIEYCECEDCLDSDAPCKLDSDAILDCPCIGCYEARELLQEMQDQIDAAQGRF